MTRRRAVFAFGALLSGMAVGFGWRTVRHRARTGDSGWRMSRTPADRAMVAALGAGLGLLVAGTARGMAVPVATADGATVAGGGRTRQRRAGEVAGAVVGTASVLGGTAITLWAQAAMGDSWRIGVQPGERTELVTHGPFAWVRNPVFTGMLAVATGTWCLVPNRLTLAGLVLATAAIEVQVRRSEEPNMLAVHGDAYRVWAARTGRFLPCAGRLARQRVRGAVEGNMGGSSSGTSAVGAYSQST